MISTIFELPESLRDKLAAFMEAHPEHDQDTAIAAAIAVFLAGQ